MVRKLCNFFLFPKFSSYTFAALMENPQLKQLILKATELFKKYGIKSLTMDEIAKELGMSKKTIYRFVKNKADLVKMVMQYYLQTEKEQVEQIIEGSENSVEELIKIADYFMNQMQEFNAHVLHDLKRYYPESWNIYNHYQFDFVLKRVYENILNGKAQGLYRTEVDADIISKIYIGGIDVLFNQELFPVKNYAFINLYKEYLNYYLHGIVSSKGVKLLEQQNIFKKVSK